MSHAIDNPKPRLVAPKMFWLNIAILGLFGISAFSTLWLPEHSWPRFLLGGVLIAWTAIEFQQSKRNTESSKRPNLKTSPMRRSELIWIVAFTLLAAAAMYCVGVYFGAYRNNPQDAIFDKTAFQWLRFKVPTVIAQQFFLHLLLMPLLIRLFQNVAISIWVGGIVFAALHLPNPVLMLITFVGGTAWLASYQRSKEIWPLVGSHLVLAVLAAAFGGEYLLNMRVGQSCVELFPSTIQSDSGQEWEFPCSSVGCVERMTQSKSSIKIEGWAYDCIHAECPKALSIRINGKLLKIDNVAFKQSDCNQFSQTKAAGFVGDQCYSFVAEIPLKLLRDEQPFELLVCNQNQHWAKLGTIGDLKKHSRTALQPVVLFPVEIDGRVESIRQHDDAVLVTGWAADLPKQSLANRIVVQDATTSQTFQLTPSQRLKRPGIVRAYSQPSFAACGFELKLPNMTTQQAERLQFFAQDDSGQLHPLGFIQNAPRSANAGASPDADPHGKIIR